MNEVLNFIQPRDAWDKLSMREKAEMMKVAVRNGIYNLKEIREKYNEFAEGGDTDTDWSYDNWKRLISEHMGIRPDEDNTYDYEAYFNKYPEEAWKMLKGDPSAHFSDEFKTVYHPTFSSKSVGNDGSIYSGVVNSKTNPQGLVGGIWSPDYHTFTMSSDGYRGPVSMDDRKWYLENAEDNGVQLREADGSLPIYDGIPWGGVLPNVTVYGTRHSLGGPIVEVANEYRHGGGIHIAPSKKGTFTAAAKKHGKSVQAFASQILAHPENYFPVMRKKANFARNARKWKHGDGGNLFAPGGYVRNKNGSPVAFDEEGNLIDQITEEQGTMMLPEITVIGRNLTKPYYSSFDSSAEPYIELFGALSKGIQPLSLSQHVGAAADAMQGKRNYFDSLFNGNSGFFTDKYTAKHPWVSTLGNMAGDALLASSSALLLKPKNILKMQGIKQGVLSIDRSGNLHELPVRTLRGGVKDALGNIISDEELISNWKRSQDFYKMRLRANKLKQPGHSYILNKDAVFDIAKQYEPYATKESILKDLENNGGAFALENGENGYSVVTKELNTSGIQRRGTTNNADVHERAHLFRNEKDMANMENINWSKLNLDEDEAASRGTQIKSMLGIKDNTPITADQLKYMKDNFVRLTGMDNYMQVFLNSITDFDSAASWLSKYSYSLGGALTLLKGFKGNSKKKGL